MRFNPDKAYSFYQPSVEGNRILAVFENPTWKEQMIRRQQWVTQAFIYQRFLIYLETWIAVFKSVFWINYIDIMSGISNQFAMSRFLERNAQGGFCPRLPMEAELAIIAEYIAYMYERQNDCHLLPSFV